MEVRNIATSSYNILETHFPAEPILACLGLGYNPNVNQKDIERAAVIHYNGIVY
jgi:hypothetical protein